MLTEMQTVNRHVDRVEEGESGRKNEKLVSNCIGEGHSKAWRNEVIGSLYWHVFIYVLKTSL